MPAAYDNFDYQNYWQKRDYEHQSEIIAIKSFLEKIPNIKTLADIGCGYGRLVPTYFHRAKRIILTDPSASELRDLRQNIKKLEAKHNLKKTNTRIIHAKAENLKNKIYKNTIDLVILVRVIHHVQDPEEIIKIISGMLKKDGYLILEFANKIHGKAVIKNFLKGDLVYPANILPKQVNQNTNSALNFNNYHPDMIKELLQKNKFEIVAVRSVSNIRSQTLKKHLPLPFLLWLEKYLQVILCQLKFGPSIFILAKKRG